MATMKGRRVLVTAYLDPEVNEDLKALSKSTRVPMAAYLREAVNDVLKKYAKDLRKAKK